MLPKRTTVTTALAIAFGVVLTACSTNQAAPASTSTTPLTQPGGAPQPGTYLTIPDRPASANDQIAQATPASRNVVDSARGLLGLQDPEAACLANRLDADPALRDALGAQPRTSPRYNDLVTLSQDCIRTTTGAVSFANGIAAQAAGTGTELNAATLDCLRNAWANLDPKLIGELVRASANPGTTNPSAQSTIDKVLQGCNVDKTKLRPAGPH